MSGELISSYQCVSFPQQIIKGAGCLAQVYSTFQADLKRVMVVGGKTALDVTQPILIQSCPTNMELNFTWYGGEVSQKNLHQLLGVAKCFVPDALIAVGGGKALDMGKWLADQLTLPITTVPTIAATCSAVSSVSIEYDDAGHYVDMIKFARAPHTVVLDCEIIAQAPKRWLAAGIGDTLAKLYEFRAISGQLQKCSFNYAAYANGKLCFDLIETFAEQAIVDVEHHTPSQAIEAVMDAIFIFAGFTSIMGIGDHVAAAHALFEGFTVNEKTRSFGHGLLVGFGNLVLLELEQRSEQEILDAIGLAKRCGIPTSIDDIANLNRQELQEIAELAVATSDMKNMPMVITSHDLVAAIQKVSMLATS